MHLTFFTISGNVIPISVCLPASDTAMMNGALTFRDSSNLSLIVLLEKYLAPLLSGELSANARGSPDAAM